MGTDINIIVEEQVDGKWVLLNPDYPTSIRSYMLFSLLSTVRGPFKPLVKPRGYPKVEDEKTQAIINQFLRDPCYHDPTWYLTDELITLLDELGPIQEYYEKFHARGMVSDLKEEVDEEFSYINSQRDFGNRHNVFNKVLESDVDYDEELLQMFEPRNCFSDFYRVLDDIKASTDNITRMIIVFDC